MISSQESDRFNRVGTGNEPIMNEPENNLRCPTYYKLLRLRYPS